MKPLYKYQQAIVDDDRKRCGIFLGTGTGKTRVGLELMQGSTLVICPKQQFLENMWENKMREFEIDKTITTISKETFRRDWEKLPHYDTVIVDECHHMLGVTPEMRQRKGVQIPKTSQMFESLLGYIRKHEPERLYLCSATPVSKPMNMWAIATILGEKWDYLKFREKYYKETLIGRRKMWMPRKSEELSDRLAELVKRFGYTGKMSDFIEVPEQTHLMPSEIPYIDLTPEQDKAIMTVQLSEADPMVMRGRMRTIENGIMYTKVIEEMNDTEDRMVKGVDYFHSEKIDYILERAVEFPKMLIFANYTAQINMIASALARAGYKVSTLTGQTKHRETLVAEVEADEAHILVAQSAIAEGYELPSVPVVIYASKSNRHVYYEQSLGRVLRRNHLKKNLYIHLIVRGADEDCHDAIMLGQDFQEKLSNNITKKLL